MEQLDGILEACYHLTFSNVKAQVMCFKHVLPNCPVGVEILQRARAPREPRRCQS